MGDRLAGIHPKVGEPEDVGGADRFVGYESHPPGSIDAQVIVVPGEGIFSRVEGSPSALLAPIENGAELIAAQTVGAAAVSDCGAEALP